MKFSIGVLYKNLFIKRDFCENLLSDPHTLLQDINKFL